MRRRMPSGYSDDLVLRFLGGGSSQGMWSINALPGLQEPACCVFGCAFGVRRWLGGVSVLPMALTSCAVDVGCRVFSLPYERALARRPN